MRTVINGTELYLAPDDLPEFSYSLTELTDYSKVKGATSTSFELPATNGTRVALGGPSMQEEVETSVPIRIGNEGQVLFEGTCRPVEWNDDTITIEAYGDNATWIAEAKNTKANTLDLGTSGQVENTMQEDSWVNEDRADVYPLIDYGRFYNFTASTNVIEQYLYPAVRVWKILQAFFQGQGYTVKAQGGFTRLFKKLIIPYNGGPVNFRGEYYEPQSFRLLASVTADASSGLPFTLAIGDPAGIAQNTGTYYNNYVPVNDARYRFRFDGGFTVTRNGTAAQVSPTTQLAFRMQRYNAPLLPWTTIATRTFPLVWNGGAVTTQSFPIAEDLFEVALEEGETYRIVVDTIADFGPDDTVVLDQGSRMDGQLIGWNGWQDRVDFDIAATIDKSLSVADIISTLVNVFRLVVRTDQATNEVIFQHLDDYLRDIDSGIDWRERLSHNDPPTKVAADLPSRYIFRWADDTSDKQIREHDEFYGRALGEGVYEMGGIGEEIEVTLKFAPTNTKGRFDDLMIPAIEKDDDGSQGVDHLNIKPRMLVFAGLTQGNWTFDGVARTSYPRAYFQGNGVPDQSLDFGSDWRQGALDAFWRNSLERSKLPSLRGEFRVYDDEFMGFDFARPRLVNDGHGDVWMYVQSVKGKKFGDDDLVECELIPV
jgi:hypothetical protein